MRAAHLLFGLAVVSLVTCESATGPTGDLDGKWGYQSQTPAGGGISMSLTTSGTTVKGVGQVCYLGGGPCYPGTVTIAGQHVPDFGSFRLGLTDGHAWTAVYSGAFVGHDQLVGTWTDTLGSGTLTFNRVK
jgi:hypothetical protein